MSKLQLFTLAFLLTAAVLLIDIYLHRPGRNAPKLVPVAPNVYITAQLAPKNLPFLRTRDIDTLVDIRPDGEADDEAPSAQIDRASRLNGLDFHYIPVPHEYIPDEAVSALGDVLSHQPGRTVLYCRSGHRAVRTFALAEASQPRGPSVDAILQMVRTAGFSADDLRDDIAQRIAHRTTPAATKPDERPNS